MIIRIRDDAAVCRQLVPGGDELLLCEGRVNGAPDQEQSVASDGSRPVHAVCRLTWKCRKRVQWHVVRALRYEFAFTS